MSIVGTSSSKYWSDFDPRSIGGCKLWLDAADARTVVLSGGNVTGWRDKSGQSMHMTTHTPFGFPTVSSGFLNGLDVLNFSCNMMTAAYATPYPIGDMYLILASKVQPAVRTDVAALPGNSGRRGVSLLQTFVNWESWHGTFTDACLNNQLSEDASASTFVLLNWTHYLRQGRIQRYGRPERMISPNATVDSWIERICIGASDTSSLQIQSNCLQAYVAEILLYSNILPPRSRQSVEAYLTWKWGLGTPASFVPTSIPGCRVWLDAADISSGTTFSDGANIAVWKDKSGNGNDASASSVPVYDVSYQGVAFRNGAYMRLPTGCLATPGSNPMTWAIVASVAAFPATSAGLFGLTDPSSLVMLLGNNGRVDICGSAMNGPVAGRGVGTRGQRFSAMAIFSNTASYYHLERNGTTAVLGNRSRPKNAGSNVVLGAAGALGGTPFTGFIHEVVAYSNALTFVQRQELTMYLSRKWQIEGPTFLSLPYSHPNASVPPLARPFGPADLSGLALWLDPGKREYVQLNSVSRVSNWIDRGRFGCNVCNALTTGNYGPGYSNTINGIPVLSFDGTSPTAGNSLSNTTFSTPALSNCFLFAVTVPTTTTAVLYGNTNLFRMNIPRLGFPYYDGSTNIQRGIATYTGTTLTTSAESVAIAGQADVFGAIYHPVDFSAQVVTRTGAPYPISGFPGATSLRQFWIGSISGNREFYAGDVGEYLIGQSSLSSSERQQLEGYLAWKWGLHGRLPASHSCANLPPTTTQFNPGQLADLVSWYDFSDKTRRGVRGTCNAAYVLANDICGVSLVQRVDASQGFFDLSGPNGEAILRFTTNGQSLRTVPPVYFTVQSTIFVVHRSGPGESNVIDSYATINNLGVGWTTGGSNGTLAFRQNFTAARNIVASNVYPSNDWYLTSVVNSNRVTDTSDVNWRVNGVRRTITMSGSANVFTTLTNGLLTINPQKQVTGASTLGEFLYFNRALVPYEVDFVESWLAQKWRKARTWTSTTNLFRDITL